MSLEEWKVVARFEIRCNYCSSTFVTADTCKNPREAVKEVMEYGYAIERNGVMCDECRRSAIREADIRGRYQVLKFEGYEEWRYIKENGSYAHFHIVEEGKYPTCPGCKHMWPIARLNPNTHLCPNCTEEIEDAEKRTNELNRGRNH